MHRLQQGRSLLCRGASIRRADEIAFFSLDPAFIEALEAHLERNVKLELTRSEGRLYVTVDGQAIEGAIERVQYSA